MIGLTHPIWLRSAEVIDQKLEYIRMDPVKEGLVAEPHQYMYSSAGVYAGLPGMVSVQVL